MKKSLETKIVDAVLKELSDRKGFDYFWHNIDSDIKKEIKKTLATKVSKVIQLHNKPSKKEIETFIGSCKYEKQDF